MGKTTSLLLLAALLAVTLLPAGAATAGSTHTYFQYFLPASIGAGVLTPAEGAEFTIRDARPDQVIIDVEQADHGSWSLQLRTGGEPLEEGLHETRFTGPQGDDLGMQFSQGPGCQLGDGWIEIHEIAVDGDELTAFAADLEVRCTADLPSRASFRLDSTVGPAPETPGTLEVALEGDWPIQRPYVSVWSDEWGFPIRMTGTREVVDGRATVPLFPGTYYVYGANYEPHTNTLYDYFGEWYRDVPELLLWDADPIVVHPGQTTSITITLDPLFEDMFDHTFTQDILWMQQTGITKGCGASLYCPDEPVTRGQMAAFLARALQLPAASTTQGFADTAGSTFEADIDRLAAAGITKGCSAGHFCPDDLVTRGQMAAFLVRSMGYADRGGFSFTDDDGSVFEADIERLAAAGVTTGCGTGRFCPDELVTRGQMGAFLHRALGGGVLYLGSAGEQTRPSAVAATR